MSGNGVGDSRVNPGMRSPSIVPGFDVDVYLILDDFGRIGRAYRETDEEEADRASIVRSIIEGEYNNPIRVVAFNTTEGWSRDVTEDIAREIRDYFGRTGEQMSAGVRDFIDYQLELTKRYVSAG